MKSIYVLLSLIWEGGRKAIFPYCVGGVLSVVSCSLINIYLPFFFKGIIEQISCGLLLNNTFRYSLLLYVILHFINKFIGVGGMFFVTHLEKKSIRLLSCRIFEHLHRLPYKFHRINNVGTITTIANGGIIAFKALLKDAFFSLLPLIIECIGAFVLLSSLYNLRFILVIIIFFVLYGCIMLFGNSWLYEYRCKAIDTDIENAGFYASTLLNNLTIKLFNLEIKIFKQYRKKIENLELAVYAVVNRSMVLTCISALIISVVLFLVLFFTGKEINKGKFTLGDLVLIHTYLFMFIKPLQGISVVYRNFKDNINKIKKLADLFNELPEGIGKIILFPANLQPSISFKEVSFRYINQYIFEKLSFDLMPNSTLGILGPSGSGKSSLIKLLLRLFVPQLGDIHIGGHSIQTLPLGALREFIAVVPQEIVLFNDTIAANISFRKDNIGQKDIEKACKLACIHDAICSFSQGYNTYVGEGGNNLSGGERQRIGIARALAKQASIYIFDEPTMFLDTNSAIKIRKTIQEVRKNHTCIIISHNPVDLEGADQLLYLSSKK